MSSPAWPATVNGDADDYPMPPMVLPILLLGPVSQGPALRLSSEERGKEMTELRTIPQPRTCRICGGVDEYHGNEFVYHRCRIDLDAQRNK